MAGFKRYLYGEALKKQQRIQNDVEDYIGTKVRPSVQPRKVLGFPIWQKTQKKSKRKGTKPKTKVFSEAFVERVDKSDLINSLERASTGITFGQIARGDIDSAKENC